MTKPDGRRGTRNPDPDRSRRRSVRLLGSSLGAMLLAGCDRVGETESFARLLKLSERLDYRVHRLLGSRDRLAQEFAESDLSPEFRSNGTAMPDGAAYRTLAQGGFADWRLEVLGLVEQPSTFTLAQLRAMPARTQITRHDCVEGWSAIGKWTGVPLGLILDHVRPAPDARFVVFHCADTYDGEAGPTAYYESIDLRDAHHPQTILAYALNDATLPIANGAPLRVRIERQLGYKMAKYIDRIELVASLDGIGGGNGGFWEDLGYRWYAGI